MVEAEVLPNPYHAGGRVDGAGVGGQGAAWGLIWQCVEDAELSAVTDKLDPAVRAAMTAGRPAQVLVLSFAGFIAIGTILLWLPVAWGRGPVSLLHAFFTATSAVCVTGLIVVDTPNDFSLFGQLVVMVLIQIGGLRCWYGRGVGFT